MGQRIDAMLEVGSPLPPACVTGGFFQGVPCFPEGDVGSHCDREALIVPASAAVSSIMLMWAK